MNRGVVIVANQLLADENGVFKVVAAPRQERHENVSAESELAMIGARSVREDVTLLHAVARADQRLLIDASVLVRSLEFRQQVNVRTDFAAEHAGLVGLDAHDDALGVHLIHDAVAAADDDRARITRRHTLHAGANERSLALDKRHSLALHVRAHQRAVRVVVLEERDEARGHGDELLRRDVNVIHFVAALQNEVAGLPAIDEFSGDAQLFIERGVSLRNDVTILFPRREIEAIRLDNHAPALQFLVGVVNFFLFDDLARLELAVSGIHDSHVVNHAPALDLAVGRLDEAELVDASVA